jgi:hypothetical protein
MNNQSVNTIYCDESGFTGNDLFSPEQPYFVYSSVLISPFEARDVVQQAITDFKLQVQELKGSTLLSTNRGKAAVTWILEKYSSNACIMAFDKRYALAAKFFEYVFEPVIASNNLLFYNVGFHRFISSVLYLHFITGQAHTENILADFQTAMRSKDVAKLESIFNIAGSTPQLSDFLRQILTFAICHKETISDELKSLKENDATGTWILELTLTALFNLLTKWGENIDGLEVFCDDSKPLVSQGDFFDVMINRKDRKSYEIGGKSHPLTFNLARPIQLANSKDQPGIQLADIFASSIAYALKSNDDFAKHCKGVCYKCFHENSVFPQLEYADLSQKSGYVNAMILAELLDRTLHGHHILDGMENYIFSVDRSYTTWLKHNNNFKHLPKSGS